VLMRRQVSHYQRIALCLASGISFLVSRPLDLCAQSRAGAISQENNAPPLYAISGDWEHLVLQSAQETSQVETSDVSAKPVVKPSSSQAGSDGQSLLSKTDPDKTKKKAHRGSLVPAPLPISSPAIGIGIVLGLGYIFPFSRNDKISPPSTVGVAGLATNDGSRGIGAGADLYMKENTYQITSFYVHGNVNYNLYSSGGFTELKLPLVQSGDLFRAEVLRRLWWKVFVGPRFWTGQSFTTLGLNNSEVPPALVGLGLHNTMRALGLRLIRDTRPNQFYPTAGEKLEVTSDFFMQSLGSKYSFQAYRFTFNKYVSLGKNQVLAYDLFACGTSGKPPFYGNCIYGTKNELRGYTAGKYFDRYMAATQVEYRLTLPKGFGLAVFGGVGGVIPGSSQVLFKNDHFLPDIGAGPRYELSKKYHVNLRTDFARGIGSWTWSMGVGEAF
jgi:Omp85 superfamily domain